MNDSTKVSEITVQDIADYIRLDDDVAQAEAGLLAKLLDIAKSYIVNYTGRTLEELDNYPDFVIVVYILCQNMYDTRAMYVEDDKLEKVFESILGMHSVNLLPDTEANQ